MSQPTTSKYDPDPWVAPSGDGPDDGPSPDSGKELDNLVPEVEVAWSTPPSFNDEPPTGGGGGGGDEETQGYTKLHLAGLRAAEQTVLGAARTAVASYEALKDNVLRTEGHIFGQNTKEEEDPAGVLNNAPSGVFSDGLAPTEFAGEAVKFANELNPAQERALGQIAAALVQVGDFVALVNRSGQGYAQVDRAAHFPAAPSGNSGVA